MVDSDRAWILRVTIYRYQLVVVAVLAIGMIDSNLQRLLKMRWETRRSTKHMEVVKAILQRVQNDHLIPLKV